MSRYNSNTYQCKILFDEENPNITEDWIPIDDQHEYNIDSPDDKVPVLFDQYIDETSSDDEFKTYGFFDKFDPNINYGEIPVNVSSDISP